MASYPLYEAKFRNALTWDGPLLPASRGLWNQAGAILRMMFQYIGNLTLHRSVNELATKILYIQTKQFCRLLRGGGAKKPILAKMRNFTGPDCATDAGVILKAAFNCTINSSAFNMGHLEYKQCNY